MSELRVAFAAAAPGGLALGDPTGTHVLLTPAAVEHRTGEDDPPARTFPWERVRALDAQAPVSRARRPGGMAVLLGTAAEAVGLSWTPSLAPVTVTVDDGDHVALECDGYIGPGYWGPHLDALAVGLRVLAARPAARAVLARPDRVLADLDAVAGSAPDDAERHLAGAWDPPAAES